MVSIEALRGLKAFFQRVINKPEPRLNLTALRQLQTTHPEAQEVYDQVVEGVERRQLGIVDIAHQAVLELATAEANAQIAIHELAQQLEQKGQELAQAVARPTFEGEAAQLRAQLAQLQGQYNELNANYGKALTINQQWVDEGKRLEQEIDHHRAYNGSVSRIEFFGAGMPIKTDKNEVIPPLSFRQGDFAMVTDVGRKRDRNQDSCSFLRLADGREAYLVADGMGGHKAGEVASQRILQQIAIALEAGETLYNAIAIANQLVAPTLEKGSGSTLVLAIVDRRNNMLQIAQVGDSRCKFIQPDQAYLLTADHKIKTMLYIAQELGGNHAAFVPPLTEQQMAAYDAFPCEMSNVITSAIGAETFTEIRITEVPLVPATANSTLALFSDGAVDGLAESELSRIARENDDPLAVAEGIRAAAFPVSSDNISVIALKLPYTLDLARLATNNYRFQQVASSALKAEELQFFNPRLAPLAPEERNWVYALMERVPGLSIEQQGRISQEFSFAQLPLENIVSCPLEQQLQILTHPLNPEVARRLIGSLVGTTPGIDRVRTMFETGTLITKQGAYLALRPVVRQLLTGLLQTATGPERKAQIKTHHKLLQTYVDNGFLRELSADQSESPEIRNTAASVVEALRKKGLFS